jgi:hypothetical protein
VKFTAVADVPERIWYSVAFPFVTVSKVHPLPVAVISPPTAVAANNTSPDWLGVILGVLTVAPLEAVA